MTLRTPENMKRVADLVEDFVSCSCTPEVDDPNLRPQGTTSSLTPHNELKAIGRRWQTSYGRPALTPQDVLSSSSPNDVLSEPSESPSEPSFGFTDSMMRTEQDDRAMDDFDRAMAEIPERAVVDDTMDVDTSRNFLSVNMSAALPDRDRFTTLPDDLEVDLTQPIRDPHGEPYTFGPFAGPPTNDVQGSPAESNFEFADVFSSAQSNRAADKQAVRPKQFSSPFTQQYNSPTTSNRRSAKNAPSNSNEVLEDFDNLPNSPVVGGNDTIRTLDFGSPAYNENRFERSSGRPTARKLTFQQARAASSFLHQRGAAAPSFGVDDRSIMPPPSTPGSRTSTNAIDIAEYLRISPFEAIDDDLGFRDIGSSAPPTQRSGSISFNEPSTPRILDPTNCLPHSPFTPGLAHSYPPVYDYNAGRYLTRPQLDELRKKTDPEFKDDKNWGTKHYFSGQVVAVDAAEDLEKKFAAGDWSTTWRSLQRQASRIPPPDPEIAQQHMLEQGIRPPIAPPNPGDLGKKHKKERVYLAEASSHFRNDGAFMENIMSSGHTLNDNELLGLNLQSMLADPKVHLIDKDFQHFGGSATFLPDMFEHRQGPRDTASAEVSTTQQGMLPMLPTKSSRNDPSYRVAPQVARFPNVQQQSGLQSMQSPASRGLSQGSTGVFFGSPATRDRALMPPPQMRSRRTQIGVVTNQDTMFVGNPPRNFPAMSPEGSRMSLGNPSRNNQVTDSEVYLQTPVAASPLMAQASASQAIPIKRPRGASAGDIFSATAEGTPPKKMSTMSSSQFHITQTRPVQVDSPYQEAPWREILSPPSGLSQSPPTEDNLIESMSIAPIRGPYIDDSMMTVEKMEAEMTAEDERQEVIVESLGWGKGRSGASPLLSLDGLLSGTFGFAPIPVPRTCTTSRSALASSHLTSSRIPSSQLAQLSIGTSRMNIAQSNAATADPGSASAIATSMLANGPLPIFRATGRGIHEDFIAGAYDYLRGSASPGLAPVEEDLEDIQGNHLWQ